jgi:hypothetical protein
MLMAQLRGKLHLADWATSEDLLTSAVFGTLKNLSGGFAALLFSNARPLAPGPPPYPIGSLTWLFWPIWDTCEPDVVAEDDANLYVIEAKLFAGFAEDAGRGSQLRREWIGGSARAVEVGKDLWLLVVTNHSTPPWPSIVRQLEDAGADPTRVCWLSWFDVGRFLQEVNDPAISGWRDDLLELLARMGLLPFEGFETVAGYARSMEDALPWTRPLALDLQSGVTVGFGPILAYVAATRFHPDWRVWAALTTDGVAFSGFSQAAQRAAHWLLNGGPSWAPTLKR